MFPLSRVGIVKNLTTHFKNAEKNLQYFVLNVEIQMLFLKIVQSVKKTSKSSKRYWSPLV